MIEIDKGYFKNYISPCVENKKIKKMSYRHKNEDGSTGGLESIDFSHPVSIAEDSHRRSKSQSFMGGK